jgi:HK97 family phage portal protein
MSDAPAPAREGFLATLASFIGHKLIGKATVAPAGPSGRWLWPSAPWGNGDRGPPGSWQRNMNGPHGGYDLMAFSAVYACVNTIASDIAKLPIQIFRLEDNGARTLLRDDYYANLMREPNHYQTAADFIQTFVQSYLLQGNTYSYCGNRNRRGEVTSLHVLHPQRTKPLVNQEDGNVFYECGKDPLAGLFQDKQTISERDMIHHRLPMLPGYPLVGVTPIFAAAASSALGIQILRDSQQFFANASRPSGVLTTEQHMADDLKTRLKNDWQQAYRGGEFGQVAVLSGGLNWQPLTITAQDAQLIEQLRYSVEDVARVFRVPPFMLGDMSKVSYRNTEQLGRAYLTNCIGWHIEAIQQRLARAFDFPADYELRFDLSAMLRTEIDVRFAAYNQGIAGGWISPNEVRTQEGLAPAEGGDEPRMQMQMVPLSQANGPPAPAAPAPTDEPPPEDAPPEPEPEASINPARVRALLRQRLAA